MKAVRVTEVIRVNLAIYSKKIRGILKALTAFNAVKYSFTCISLEQKQVYFLSVMHIRIIRNLRRS